ncbi:MAG: hypothetical protein Q7T20_10230 [Saprospiraceae bacterium]|nr:hypothetical protein [Saprospiraceae bacterium]
MASQSPISRIFLFALPLLALLIWLGSRNRPDPLWAESGRLLRQPATLISEAPDSLQSLYCQLHNVPFVPGDSTAFRLAMQPSPTNIEWVSFKKLAISAATSPMHRIVVSGVTGVGSTKMGKRVANLLAGSYDRVLQIDCAPWFDVEYHKEYIGKEDEKGKFYPGELLLFWDRCRKNPDQKFVVVFDNFDKINPETFFGPALWEALSAKKPVAEVGGKTVELPDNCYLFSITHYGPGSVVEFNGEHFKRLGDRCLLEISPRDLVAWLRLQERGAERDPVKLAALRDTAQMHRFVFYFLKTNQLLNRKYTDGHQMGQGSNIRPLYMDADREKFKLAVMSHLNALKPDKPLKERDFRPIEYTIRNGGMEDGSSVFARLVQNLHETGYLVEITMVGTTALLTALVGYLVFRRREQLIRRYGDRARQVFQNFEDQQISAEEASNQLEAIKREVDELVLRRSLGYTEGLYFLAFIEDMVKRIEFARSISENFLELFGAFMEDDMLTEGEYLKLKQFLQSMRHKIPTDVYDQFNLKVESTYAATTASNQ